MKSDLDQLMQKYDVDVLFILGAAEHNPAMVYFVGNAHVSQGYLIKKRGEEPVLVHYPMEREEAAKSGLRLISTASYPLTDLLKETKGNLPEALALQVKKIFDELGIRSGNVALYGKDELNGAFAVITNLQRLLPELQFRGLVPDELLMTAMMTKDEAEIERIRRMGRITTEVVARTADYLTGHRVKNEVLVHTDDSPVTIGEVKNLINLWLAEKGAENPEGTIFAIGRDAGIPHSAGNPTDLLRLGQTIVYDIYPCEAGGGYFYDFTRTWSLGYATDEAIKLYEEVKRVYELLHRELELNAPFSRYQARTCELFEAMGHTTVKTQPETESGYVHSLGHGIGLHVHEKPFSSMVNPSPTDLLVPGAAFTLEPGLYYPERGLGVRLEDSLWVTPQGKFEILADFPKELVLPVKH